MTTTERPFSKFNAVTAQFSLENSYALVQASQLAYSAEAMITARCLDWKFERIKFLDVGSTQAFIASNEKIVVVAFRGTKDFRDWITDSRMALVPAKAFGRIHAGFRCAFNEIWSTLLVTIETFQDRGQSLWITGHSLGGALACLAADLLSVEDKPVNGIYTFGQPRVGDHNFAKEFDLEMGERMFRFVNDADIVPRLPPRALGYSHVGGLRFIDKAGQLHSDEGWWLKFLNEVKVGLEFLKSPKEIVSDHLQYVKALEMLQP